MRTKRNGFFTVGVISLVLICYVCCASAFVDSDETYIANTCLEDNTGGQKVLVAYASRYGSTATVAIMVRDVLCKNGFQVDLSPARKITDVSGYDAVILGSAINRLRIVPEATQFLKKHRQKLSEKTVRFFILCSALREDTPEMREFALTDFLEPSLADFPEIQIVDSGQFGGVVDYSDMNFVESFVMSVILRQTEGDFRNTRRIIEWAELISVTLNTKD